MRQAAAGEATFRRMSRAILLIPGFLDTPRLFHRMEPALRRAGHRTAGMTLDPNTGVRGMDELALDLARFIDERFPGERVSVVGFSMGAIVARWWAQRLGGAARLDRLVTIAAPHRGTLPAALLPLRGLRQLRRGSDFLAALNADVATLAGCGPASIWSWLDYMIIPPGSARLGIGEELRLCIPLHFWIPRSGRVIREVLRLLAPEEPRGDPGGRSPGGATA